MSPDPVNEDPVNAVRYRGRLKADATRPGYRASVHGPTLLEATRAGDVVYIDDPISFPWELGNPAPDAPLIVDVSSCSADQLAALGPVLDSLTQYDSVVTATSAPSELAPSSADLRARAGAKHLDRVEGEIIERLENEHNVLVVDGAALSGSEQGLAAHWSEPREPRPPAVLVRLARSTITAQRAGFANLATRLVSQVDGTEVIDVWGVRRDAGDPVERGLVLIGRG